MQDQVNAALTPHKRLPWNKGKLTGAKPPLRPKYVWSIRTKLQIEGRARDLAMFNLAIDSKLRGCDVVAIRVEDVAVGGYTADRATVKQKKTGRPVRFELGEQTRQAVDDYLKATDKRPGEFLFTGYRGPDRSMTTRQYARLVSEWIGSVGLDPRLFGTHSLRRTKATLIYRRTGNLTAVQLLLGLRMAIGARRTHVLLQFLAESVILSVTGGVAGIIVGVLFSGMISIVAGWPAPISLAAVAGGFLFSAAVGIFFGYYPARKAASLDPIEALRYE